MKHRMFDGNQHADCQPRPRTIRLAAFVLGALLLGTGCASFELVQLPARDADVYPFSETKGGVSLAIDEITEPERAKKYFGRDLLEDGILPIHIVVSNHGDQRIIVGPPDLLLMKGREVIDPLPVEMVAALSKDRTLIVTDGASQHVDEFFSQLVFKETVLAPRDSYNGVLFFEAVRKPTIKERFFRVFRPFPQPTLKLYVAITDPQSGDRIHFGPFGVYR